MAGDPKYANLPYLDSSSTYLFESSDLPEDEQHVTKKELFSDPSIQSESINSKDAHKKFASKYLSSDHCDFSVGVRGQRGYIQYEMHGQASEDETLIQKVNRLQLELSQAAEQVKAEQNALAESDASSLNQTAKQVEALQQSLTQLHLTTILGASATSSSSTSASYKSLIESLEASADKKDRMPVRYDLRVLPDSVTSFASDQQAAALEKRIESLEKCLGISTDAYSKLTAISGDSAEGCTSLLDCAHHLEEQTRMLNPKYLDQVETRLNTLNQQLVHLADKKEKIDDKEKDDKVNSAYELLKKYEATCDSVPRVLERLRQLAPLHEQALQFSQALTQLDTQQDEISALLKSDSQLLYQVQSDMKANMLTIQTACASLEDRMKKLGQK